jgi:hypothetical protein
VGERYGVGHGHFNDDNKKQSSVKSGMQTDD